MKLAIAATVILGVLAVAVMSLRVSVRPEGISPSEHEIRALSAAIENYRAGEGHYPTDPASTELLKSNQTFDSEDYIKSSAFLYQTLSGNGQDSKNYLAQFPLHRWTRKNMSGETYLVDPWGHSLGYSTFKAMHPESSAANNAVYDFWSTGGRQRQPDMTKWIKNW